MDSSSEIYIHAGSVVLHLDPSAKACFFKDYLEVGTRHGCRLKCYMIICYLYCIHSSKIEKKSLYLFQQCGYHKAGLHMYISRNIHVQERVVLFVE